MTCPYCKTDQVITSIGMYFIAYQCQLCGHEWIEIFEGVKNDTERKSVS